MNPFTNIVQNLKFTHLTFDGTNYVLAAGTSDVDSNYLDMANFQGVIFLIVVGVMAASSTADFKVNQCDTSGGTYADLTGTAVTQFSATDDDKFALIDVFDPEEQYLKVTTTRGNGGNSTIECLMAIQYGARKLPITQPTGAGQCQSVERFQRPVEGTA